MKMSGFLMVTGRKEDLRDPPCLVVNDGSGPGSVRLGGREKEPSFGTVADFFDANPHITPISTMVAPGDFITCL